MIASYSFSFSLVVSFDDRKKKGFRYLCAYVVNPIVLFLCFVFYRKNLLVSVTFVFVFIFLSFPSIIFRFIDRNAVKSDNIILRKYDAIILKVPNGMRGVGTSVIASITITIGVVFFDTIRSLS